MPEAPVIRMVGRAGAETVLVAILLLDYLRLHELTETMSLQDVGIGFT